MLVATVGLENAVVERGGAQVSTRLGFLCFSWPTRVVLWWKCVVKIEGADVKIEWYIDDLISRYCNNTCNAAHIACRVLSATPIGASAWQL